jgi:hypothetical protein
MAGPAPGRAGEPQHSVPYRHRGAGLRAGEVRAGGVQTTVIFPNHLRPEAFTPPTQQLEAFNA